MNEKELADSVFGGLMAKAMGKMVHESEICPLVDQIEGKGQTNEELQGLRLSLSDLLLRHPDKFINCGNRNWRLNQNNHAFQQLAESISDKKSGKGGKRSARGGSNLPSFNRARSGGIPRNHNQTHGFRQSAPAHRGHHRPPAGNHGSSFRPNLNISQPNPSNDYSKMTGLHYPVSRNVLASNNGSNSRFSNQPPRREDHHEKMIMRTPYRDPSPRRGNNYGDIRGRPDSRDGYNGDRDSTRYSSPRRNEQPGRPSSRGSNISDYSQFSSDTNAESNTERRSRPDASSPDLADLARRFNSSSINVQPQPLESVASSDVLSKKIAKAVRKIMKKLNEGEKLSLENLFDEIERKNKILIPGKNGKEKEDFLKDLKKIMPKLLSALTIDTETGDLTWNEAAVTTDSPIHEYMEDDLHYYVVDYVKMLDKARFRVTDEAERLSNATGVRMERTCEKLTYVLFITFEGEYRYASGSKTEVLKISKITTVGDAPEFYQTSFEHKIFENVPANALVKCGIVRYQNVQKFAVRPEEYIKPYEKMNQEIQDFMSQIRNEKSVPFEMWRPNHACLVQLNDSTTILKWSRAMIIKIETQLIFLFILDSGFRKVVPSSDLRLMPQKFAKLPPFAIPCTLDESEDDKDNIEFGGKEYLSNGPGNLSVTCSGAATASDGILTYPIKLFSTCHGGPLTNIKDVFI